MEIKIIFGLVVLSVLCLGFCFLKMGKDSDGDMIVVYAGMLERGEITQEQHDRIVSGLP